MTPPYPSPSGLSGGGSSGGARRTPVIRLLQSPLHLLPRPQVRLKSALYLLSLTILLLVFLALNAANSPSTSTASTATGGGTLNTAPTNDSPADSGEGKNVAQGKDGHLVDEEIQRSFEEPDFGLLSGLQPSRIGCDVPLEGERKGVLIFLGIFSSGEKKGRRDLYRRVIIPDFPKHLVTVKFILGLPPFPDKPISQEAIDRSKFLAELNAENKEHGDMVILPMVDNIDLGKTHEYFKWVANEYAGEGVVQGRPRYVMKADDDTILVMPNLFSSFRDLDCSKNIYWGTSAGRSHYFGDYFRGLAYALSWPLVSWIGSADMPLAHMTKIEDARTGQWLRHLDPITDPIKRIDLGWTMGDWNQLDVTVETVALHWLKLDEWVEEQHARILEIWSNASRPYTPDHGVPTRQSVIKGRQTPEEAQKENERQKEMGWDVHGNV